MSVSPEKEKTEMKAPQGQALCLSNVTQPWLPVAT